ncbi:MAG TPA: hypothetical protein VJ724_13625 [Tahibacter sp.]|nr:hypothetical protein [Tahibacter sp.]
MTTLRRALDCASSRADRAIAANRLFQHAHRLWLSGSLDVVEYRLVLAEVDASRNDADGARDVRIRRLRRSR